MEVRIHRTKLPHNVIKAPGLLPMLYTPVKYVKSWILLKAHCMIGCRLMFPTKEITATGFGSTGKSLPDGSTTNVNPK